MIAAAALVLAFAAACGDTPGSQLPGSTPSPISIDTQPNPMTVANHGSISGNLTVAASVTGGGEVSFQWFETDQRTAMLAAPP